MPGSLKDFDEWLAKGGHITELEGSGTDHPAPTALSCAMGEAAMMIGWQTRAQPALQMEIKRNFP